MGGYSCQICGMVVSRALRNRDQADGLP